MLTSALIIAACCAGLHSIVEYRQHQARRLGVPYMDKMRRTLLLAAAAVFAVYFGGIAIAAGFGW
jgi:hypothetical protein